MLQTPVPSSEMPYTINYLHICNDFLGSKVHEQLYNELHLTGAKQTIYFTLKPHLLKKIEKLNKEWSYEVVPSALTTKRHNYIYKSKINFLYKDILAKIDLKKIDVITATTLFNDGGIALKLFKDFGIPYVVAVRSTDMDIYLKYRPDLAILAHKILKNAKQVIFISPSLKKKFENHYLIKRFFSKFQHKTSIIYNGIDEFWLRERNNAKTLSSPVKILFVGRLILRKNIFSLCEAVIELNKNNFSSVLTIIGNGPLENEVADLSNENPDSIKYIGSVTQKETLKTYYKNHHIFAMPSLGETFGLVYIEALSQSLPVLYTQEEAIDGVFEEKVGEACYPSKEGVYDALLKIFENYERFRIDEIDLSKFSWNHISKTYQTLYQRII